MLLILVMRRHKLQASRLPTLHNGELKAVPCYLNGSSGTRFKCSNLCGTGHMSSIFMILPTDPHGDAL